MTTRPIGPRIPPLPLEQRSESAIELLARVTPAGLAPKNLYTTLIRAEPLTRKWVPFGGMILNGTLPARDRELLILRTGWNCRSAYEWGQHVAIALRVGLTAEEIARAARSPSEWSGFERALIEAADELHIDSCITDATWAILATRYGDEQLIEVPMTVGQYHIVAMTMNSLGVPLDEGLAAFPTEDL